MTNPDLSSHCDVHALDLNLRGFKVYAINTSVSRTPAYSRRLPGRATCTMPIAVSNSAVLRCFFLTRMFPIPLK
jgi:hypothetical protein